MGAAICSKMCEDVYLKTQHYWLKIADQKSNLDNHLCEVHVLSSVGNGFCFWLETKTVQTIHCSGAKFWLCPQLCKCIE